MSGRDSVPDSVLVSYGLIAGGVRVLLPPVLDLPFVRSVRGAMFDRLARSAGVTLTSEARRILIDLEEAGSGRGVAEQAVRWLASRMFVAAPVIDAVRNILRTYAAGALFQRYLREHRPPPGDPVLSAFEAERCRKAMRESIDVASMEHIRAITRLATAGVRDGTARGAERGSMIQRYSDAVVSAIADVPLNWLSVLETDFVRALKK